MELKDAKQLLLISDDERKSVQEYLGYKQASVDLLLDLEPYTVASKEKDSTLMYVTADDLLEDVDIFTNVYSAMLKNQGTFDGTGVLVRKTDAEECRFFSGTTKKMTKVEVISEEDYENGFDIESGNNSVIRYNTLGSVPHIKISDFINSVDGVNQNQVLIAPFLTINKFEYEKTVDGIKYFDAVLRKKDTDKNNIDFTRKEELEKYIRENFDGFREFVSYARYSGKVVFDESYKKANAFKTVVEEYTGIRCKEKELEIEEAREIVGTEKERYEADLADRLLANKRRSMIRGMQNRILSVPSKSEMFFTKLGQLEELISLENEYVYFAKRLRIPYSRRLNLNAIRERTADIKQAVEKMCKRITKTTIHDEISEDEAREKVAPIQDDLRAIESLGLDVTGIEYLPAIFSQQMDLDMKEQIDRRAFSVIKRLRIQKYRDDLASIPENPTLWDRLTGKSQVMELQRKNLQHKIELEGLKKYEPKRTYSALEVVANLDAEAKLLGITNPEMVDFRAAIVSGFEIDEDEVKKMSEGIVQSSKNLPVRFDSKRVISNRSQIKFLKEVNSYLEEAISIERGRTQRILRSQDGKTTQEIAEEKRDFISDTEMFNRVNGMFTSIEQKTVHRVNSKEGVIETDSILNQPETNEKAAEKTEEEIL